MDSTTYDIATTSMGRNEAKILAMTTLGFGSVACGMLPIYFVRRNRGNHPFTITILLCFGAGVLLSTAIVHILSEVKEKLPKSAEIYFCVGFFIVYIIDQFVHMCYSETLHHDHHHDHNSSSDTSTSSSHSHNIHHSSDAVRQRNYGSDQETQSLIPKAAGSSSDCENNLQSETSTMCRVNPENELCDQNFVSMLGLLCALSIHSILEGLAIGVEDTGTKVLLLLLAVGSHKFVVGFCLGFELTTSTNLRVKLHFILIFIFAFGSVLGIGIGMGLVNIKDSLSNDVLPILQGLAGGTLLYVTVCEVLPREKAKWHRQRNIRAAGLIQVLSVAIGFTAMTLLNTYLGDD